MCGIACVLSPDQGRVLEIADSAVRTLAHRGPDDHGIEVRRVPAGHLGLMQTRLSIRDLSPAGHQPMVHPETGAVLIFNGEIYNHEELRADPALAGVRWRGGSDTETLLWAWHVWGPATLQRLCGMFAFLVFDPRAGTLAIARDHIGIKPLYYHASRQGLLLASEVQTILAAGILPGEIDRRAVAGVLAYGTVPEPLTMVEGIHAFPAGSWCELSLAALPTHARLPARRWWTPPAPRAIARNEAVAQVASALDQAVRSHLIADVPLGIFLSGGIDSTAIAILAAEARGGDVDALTISLPDSNLDEGEVAARTAASLGIRHHRLHLEEPEVLESFDQWLAACDQPSVDGFNTFLVSRAARARGFPVALSGLGGDELFAGYPSFRQLPAAQRTLARLSRLPRPLRRIAGRLRAWRAAPSQRAKILDLALARADLVTLYLLRRRQLATQELTRLGIERSVLALDEHYLAVDSPQMELPADAIAAISRIESEFYMRNMLLRDADVFTMRHALELRVPFLDRRLLESVYAIPGAVRAAGWDRVNKPLLVDALGGRLPTAVTSPAKRCFALPYARWIRGPLRRRFEELLRTVADSGLLDPDGVRGCWRDFLADRSGSLWARPWLLAGLGAWLSHRQRSPSVRHLSSPATP